MGLKEELIKQGLDEGYIEKENICTLDERCNEREKQKCNKICPMSNFEVVNFDKTTENFSKKRTAKLKQQGKKGENTPKSCDAILIRKQTIYFLELSDENSLVKEKNKKKEIYNKEKVLKDADDKLKDSINTIDEILECNKISTITQKNYSEMNKIFCWIYTCPYEKISAKIERKRRKKIATSISLNDTINGYKITKYFLQYKDFCTKFNK